MTREIFRTGRCHRQFWSKSSFVTIRAAAMKILLIFGLISMCVGDEELSVVTPEPESQPPNPPFPYPQPPECNCTLINHDEDTTDPALAFPTTSFTCWGRYDGYYADVEVDCTIFHYCQTWQFPTGLNETVKWDFACPQSTIFNQKILSCTPPNSSFDCKESPLYYWVNYNFSSTATSTDTPGQDYPTSNSHPGQQIIIVEPQQIQEPTDSQPVPVDSQSHPDSYDEQPVYQEPNPGPDSESFNFPDQTHV